MNPSVKLTRVLNDREMNAKQNLEFQFLFQQSVLLALKEGGLLTETQFRYAAGALKNAYHTAT